MMATYKPFGRERPGTKAPRNLNFFQRAKAHCLILFALRTNVEKQIPPRYALRNDKSKKEQNKNNRRSLDFALSRFARDDKSKT